MWDPRKVMRNAKLFAQRSPAPSCDATVASQVFADQSLPTYVAKNRFRDKTTKARRCVAWPRRYSVVAMLYCSHLAPRDDSSRGFGRELSRTEREVYIT